MSWLRKRGSVVVDSVARLVTNDQGTAFVALADDLEEKIGTALIGRKVPACGFGGDLTGGFAKG